MKNEPHQQAAFAVLIYAVIIFWGIVGGAGQVIADAKSEFRTFEGAWFKVDYPADFTVKASLSSITADGYDSAFFVSLDQCVTFYICSPQLTRRSGRGRSAFARPEYDMWWKFWEEEGWVSLGRAKNFDWMHVQAAKV